MTTNRTNTTTDLKDESLRAGVTHKTDRTQKDLNMPKTFGNVLKAIVVLSLIFSGASFLKPKPALAGGGFTASCQNIHLFTNVDRSGSADLSADCRSTGGQLTGTAVDINSSIVNVDGRLAWLKNGGFGGSSRNCSLDVGNVTTLHCQVAKADGTWVDSSLTLDDEIANYDGHLTVLDGF